MFEGCAVFSVAFRLNTSQRTPRSSRLLASMFTVASRFRRLNFVGSYLSTIEAVRTGSWLSVVQVLLDVSIALLVAIIEFDGGIHRGYRTISSEFFFVKRYMQSDLKCHKPCRTCTSITQSLSSPVSCRWSCLSGAR